MDTKDRIERSTLFQPGQSFGKFYLVQLLGEGGTSRIFKALQQPISRIVALKIPSFADSGNILTPDEFLSEATLMARLEHPNIVRIYDFGVNDDKAFICMEYVEGSNLQELCAMRHPLSNTAVLSIALQTLEALLYSHSQDVLHLDLSPANVLVSKQGSVKLSDFGMAGKRPSPGAGKVVGTPAFLSPEHVAGEACTGRSDLFSFGSLLYFTCLGEFLFDPGEDNENLADAFARIGRAREQPPEEKLRRLPAPLASLARMALAGTDPDGLLAGFKSLWAKAEGESRPEASLRRELALNAPGDSGPAASDEELRERYLRLREDGRHREAVALLEKALRRHPDSPLLQELISAPPAKVKSGPVTVEVGVPAPPPDDAKGPAGSAGSNRTRRKAALAAFVGMACLGALAIALPRLRHPEAAPAVSAPGSFPAAPSPAAPLDITPAPVAASAPSESIRPVSSLPPPSQATALSAQGATAPSAGAIAAQRPRVKSDRPALGIAGPKGTRLRLNDSVDLVSPSPRQGWNVPPGLANLVITRPDAGESLSSSLFMSPDTFYLIRLEDDGGFSVSRRRR